MNPTSPLQVKWLGQKPYLDTWAAMQAAVADRTAYDPDELWVTEHPPVYTLGLAGREQHLLSPGDIPVIRTDRGGQVTYHGPGQLLVYMILNLQQKPYGIRSLVDRMEQAVVEVLGTLGLTAHGNPSKRGVYIGEEKICAIGLRVKRGFTYHGLALNIDMDLTPYQAINPCGIPDQRITQLAELTDAVHFDEMARRIVQSLAHHLTEATP